MSNRGASIELGGERQTPVWAPTVVFVACACDVVGRAAIRPTWEYGAALLDLGITHASFRAIYVQRCLVVLSACCCVLIVLPRTRALIAGSLLVLQAVASITFLLFGFEWTSIMVPGNGVLAGGGATWPGLAWRACQLVALGTILSNPTRRRHTSIAIEGSER